jgi:hypothetical protein
LPFSAKIIWVSGRVGDKGLRLLFAATWLDDRKSIRVAALAAWAAAIGAPVCDVTLDQRLVIIPENHEAAHMMMLARSHGLILPVARPCACQP